MKALAIFTGQPQLNINGDSVQTITLDGTPIYCGLIELPTPQFDTKDESNRGMVFVRIRAFSCNYRDKTLIHKTAHSKINNSYYIIGSEFVGEVIAVGEQVDGFAIGDRVIANNHYTGKDFIHEGVPTNHASKEYQIFPSMKLIKIPQEMPDDVAASFSIGTQTVFSMIRRLSPSPGSNILITSARSNTSLAALNALKSRDVNIYALSTSYLPEEEFRTLGAKQYFRVNISLKQAPSSFKALFDFVAREGTGFDCVIDPFFDLYLARIIDFINPGGKYITCGLWGQHSAYIPPESIPIEHDPEEMVTILQKALFKNIEIIGNCLGTTEDLANGLSSYKAGKYDVIVDSTYSGKEVDKFLQRTYVDKDRIGKVVFRYDR